MNNTAAAGFCGFNGICSRPGADLGALLIIWFSKGVSGNNKTPDCWGSRQYYICSSGPLPSALYASKTV